MQHDVSASSRRAAKNPSIARHGRLIRRSLWKTAATVVASAVAVALVSGVSVAAYAAWDLARSAKPTVHLSSEKVLEGVPDVGAISGGVNLLVIGSDSRQGQGMAFGDPKQETGVLNDVTMLLHISQDHSHAEVISFPRDMFVKVPECTDPKDPSSTLSALSSVKINTTLDYGGMDCVVKTVEQLTGVTIPFAGVVQFMGVAGLSDAVGGVEVCVAEKIEDEYTNTFLDAGTHTLQGMAALQFLRTRHGVGDGSDLGRISNQQVFLSALARKLQSGGVFGDPVKLYGIAKAALSNMTLSSSLADPTRMVSIAKAMKDMDLSKVAFVQYPTRAVEGGVRASDSAEVVNAALKADKPIVFDANNESGSRIGTADATPGASGTGGPASPGASTGAAGAAASAAPTAAPASTEPAAPGATPNPTAEALPQDVLGQTAAQTKCSKGRTLADQ